MVSYSTLLLACLLGAAAANLVPSDTNLDRRSVQVSTDRSLYCGIFGSGAKDTVWTLKGDLETGGKLAARTWTIGPGQCNRVHCYDTTGIYVCNDGKKDIVLNGAMIGKGVRCVWENCCRQDYDGPKYNQGMSGQKFFEGMGSRFNIAVGYGNCRDPANIRPSNALGWGVNPVCKGGVLTPDVVSCNI